MSEQQVRNDEADQCATMIEEEANLTTSSGGVMWSGGERERLLQLAQRMRRRSR